MSENTTSAVQPIIVSAGDEKRPFAASAAALQALIINEEEQLLLLSSPTRNRDDEWQVVSGGLEAGETILDGVLREVREEIGPEVRVRPLGVVHAQTFHYDANVRYMIGIYYLLAYEQGPIIPGDDMAGSQFRWWHLEELTSEGVEFHPSTIPWMMKRAIELYRLWKDQQVPLQPDLRRD